MSVSEQLDQGVGLPPKVRIVRNLSRKSAEDHPSTNDYTKKFPTRFGGGRHYPNATRPTSPASQQELYPASSLGMTSVCFTYPLELARVRMAFRTTTASDALRPSFLRALRKIYHASASIPHGQKTAPLFEQFPFLKFYQGFTATMVGMIPYAGMSFLAWGYLRARFLPKDKLKAASPGADLIIGAVSGVARQTVGGAVFGCGETKLLRFGKEESVY
ncbi:hypothetical protein BDZ89DRAFT_1140663 [Hymenopellis radicata]|nr:hypothetical protein BDZ89DRAFT_1140663 [Hymenopellis radicata]